MLSLTIPARYRYLHLLRSVVLGLDNLYQDAEARPTPELLYAWSLAVYEAATNVIRHGFGGEAEASMTLTIEPRPDRVVFTLMDHGQGKAAWGEAALPPPAPAEHGYGMFVIQSVMSDIHYGQGDDGANVLLMTAPLTAPSARQTP